MAKVISLLTVYYNGEVFRNQAIRNKYCLWWSCLLPDRDEMSNLYREPSIDASYQVSVHLAKRFRRRFKKNRPIRNKNCKWRPCLLIDRDKMSIDASYQVSVHLAKRFQMRTVGNHFLKLLANLATVSLN